MAAEAEFLTYYLAEINHLRLAGTRFSQEYPHLATGLDFQGKETDDPQVARLIESFAFLAAKLQQQFNAQFPEVPTALLDALYPQLVTPIPSMAIAQFKVAEKQQRAMEGVIVPRMTTVYATTSSGAECRFWTGAPLQLWPVEVAKVQLQPGIELEILDDRPGVQSCLRVRLRCIGENRSFADFAPSSLHFYIDGERNSRFRLFELLTNNLVEIAVARSDGETAEFATGLTLRHVGLDLADAMLPYPEASHHGYRLIQEYFAFPDKFMFVELAGLTPELLGNGSEIDLLFLLGEEPSERLMIDNNTLRLGCVPIINLFQRTSEPIRLDHMSVEYLLEPDVRAAASAEVHSVLSVTRSAAGHSQTDLIPSYFSTNSADADAGRLRWLARRHPVTNPAISGTEVQLSFVDPAMNPMVPAEDVLFAQLLCTNRGMPRQISTATRLQIEMDLPIERIHCLARPTPPVDPPVIGENLWRLVSHLTLNKLTLQNGRQSLDPLKQILYLYSGNEENSRKRRQIDGLVSIATRSVVRRVGDKHWRGFVRGTEITLQINDKDFVGASALLLGAILDRFFALYAGVNSFTELVIRRDGQEEEWKRWPARAGEKPLL
jgi:type VI secretion system protein ImpG